MKRDDYFEKLLELLYGVEGGYSNVKGDKGGSTNLGVTQDTYDAWRKMNNLPKASVKTDLTKQEAKNIYYNMYWKKSGADKLEDLRDAMILFDMAVNSGPENAMQLFKKSNNNFYTMLHNRKKYYDNAIKYDASQLQFKDGWYNRLNHLEDNANKIINEGYWKPSYYDEITPFDKGYKGNINPVGDIPDRQNKRNKYQYLRNRAIQDGYIKSDNNDSLSFPRRWEDLTPWEREELLRRRI